MTTIEENIKHDLNVYRKAKDSFRTKVLSTILGNIQNKSKTAEGLKSSADVNAIAYLKSHLKGLKEMSTYTFNQETLDEIQIIEDYIPAQMTKEDLLNVIKNHGTGTMPDFMKILKEKYSGKYDGKLASETFKEWATN
jgi:uncharacterized protein YqeY